MTRLHPWYRWVIPLILMLALIVMLALARPAPVIAAPYDGMLTLARAADAAFDADYPTAENAAPRLFGLPDAVLADLPALAADIAAQIAEENLGLPGRMPRVASSMPAMTSSLTALALAPGVLNTTMPSLP